MSGLGGDNEDGLEAGRMTGSRRVGSTAPASFESAGYLADMINGLRRVSASQEELAYLDHLLSVAEEEARKVAGRRYN